MNKSNARAAATRLRRFQLKSIQSKIALLLTICVVISTAIVGIIFIAEISGILRDEAEDDMILTSTDGAAAINAKLGRIEEQVKTLQHFVETSLAETPTLLKSASSRAQFISDFEGRAKNHASSAEGIIGVFAMFDTQALDIDEAYGFSHKMGADGHFVADPTTPLAPTANQPSWYKAPFTSKKALWLETAPQANNGHAMAFVAPILTPNGTCIGVIGVSCDSGILQSAAAALASFETGYAFILNSNGSVLYHPKVTASTVINKRPEFQALAEQPQIVSGETSLYSYSDEDGDCYLSCITLQNGKQLCISASQDEIYQKQTSIVSSIIAIIAGVTLMALVAAVLFSRFLTRPIKALNAAAREMLEGKLDTELVPTTADEIGELTRILNRARERIRYQISDLYNEAHHDGLTGIPNKTAFRDMERAIDKRIQYGTAAFVLAVLDVNRLKVTNDFFGHAAGDELLRIVANHLKAAFGPQNIYRIGGDEFAILLQGKDTEESIATIERCVAGVALLHLPEFPEVPVSCAVGIAAYDAETDTSFRDTMMRADRLMYRNKGESKRRAEQLEGGKGIKQLQIEKFLEFLAILNNSTDDYAFLYELENDKCYFFGKILERYEIPHAKDGTVTLEQMTEAIHPADRSTFTADVKKLIDGTSIDHNVDYRLMTSDGTDVWCNCRGRVIKAEDGHPFVLVGRLSDTALRPWYSPITGLFNRNRFIQVMQEPSAPRFKAFMMLDIDNMSNINLNLGRNKGDELLRTLARRLEELFPEMPIYHMEKDRFAVLLDTADEEEIKERFTTLLSMLGNALSVSAAVAPCDDSLYVDPNSIYEYANQLLKENKSKNTGTISFFSRDDLLKKISSITLLDELRQSVANGFEGFYVVYQPQVAANGYAISGAEALLRYRSPSRGVISPAEFIPLLERTRLINRIGLFVLDTALAQCRVWREVLPSFRMAVNFSTVQMLEDATDEEVLVLLEKHGLPGDALTVELTESIQLESTEVAEAFERFRAAGIRIAIDDFGTGYANLAYLKQIHADEIKIDRIFIKDIRESTYNYMVVGNILEFARENGFHVCLEGVETPEELSTLEELQADTLQGYLFDKPIAAEDFAVRYVHASVPQWSFIGALHRHKEEAQLVHFNAKAILSNIHIGLWVIQLDGATGTAKLFGDAVMHELLGTDSSISPEECYKHWFSRIKEGHLDAVTAMVDAMSKSEAICQTIYPWNHPTLGEIVVRCTGRCTKQENGVTVFEGFHRRITEAKDIFTNLPPQ